jgi:hypothetical protein
VKIIIENENLEYEKPIVTIDTKTCHYPYAVRNAFKLALEIEGYSISTINEIFNQMPDVTKEDKK